MNQELLEAAKNFIRLAVLKQDTLALEIQSLMSNEEENSDEIDELEDFRSDLEIAISRVQDTINTLGE